MTLPNFGQMKEMYALQKKAKQVQKELKGLEIEARSADERVIAIASGEMKLTKIEISPELLNEESKTKLEQGLVETVNQALNRAQSESASRLGPILKNLNLPGV